MDEEVRSVRYGYLLKLEVDGSDRSNLIDALEDEEFPVRELLGERTMNEQIREGVLELEIDSPVKLPWFGEAVRTISVYLSEYIYGFETAEGRNAEGSRVRIEILKYVGRLGDLIAVPLQHSIAFPSGEILMEGEDREYLRRNWRALPRWAQDGYRIKFPELRLL